MSTLLRDINTYWSFNQIALIVFIIFVLMLVLLAISDIILHDLNKNSGSYACEGANNSTKKRSKRRNSNLCLVGDHLKEPKKILNSKPALLRRNNKKKSNRLFSGNTVCIAILTLAVMVSLFYTNSLVTNAVNGLTTEISNEYNINVSRSSVYSSLGLNHSFIRSTSIANVFLGMPSDKIYGYAENDNSRIYEVYICCSENGEVGLYTRSDKGVYVPISNASSATLAK